MKYTGYNKTELIEWCQCLENNYNVMKERFERSRTLSIIFIIGRCRKICRIELGRIK